MSTEAMREENIRDWKRILRYENGELIWNERPLSDFYNKAICNAWNVCHAGKVAGHVDKGYKVICVGKRKIFVHRIVFYLFNGYFPKMIDHIDGNGLNNKIENLRECDSFQNQSNKRMSKLPGSGIKGVYRVTDSDKWFSTITSNRRKIYLGSFSTKEEAARARKEAADKYHKEFACHE